MFEKVVSPENRIMHVGWVRRTHYENKSKSISVSSFESDASSKSSQVSEKHKESEFVDSDKQIQGVESKKSKMNLMNDTTGDTVIANINNNTNKMKEEDKFVKPKKTESEDDG